ncbi:AMP-binding protein, partial [Geminocystis sp. GBBB08]|uniref:AMP-binding protein n=1 Tax=Geminocystis sp. GBBB08 TaxID=2604140 RepID=UPI0027E2FAB2
MENLLHQLLQQSSLKYPYKIAVIEGENKITYQQLDLISNQLAHNLIQSGCKKSDRIGIYLNKSISAIISIFGILKAGGIYVPLPTSAPLNRIISLIEDAEIHIIITNEKQFKSLDKFLDSSSPLNTVIFTDNSFTNSTNYSQQLINWQEILHSVSIAPSLPLKDGNLQTMGEKVLLSKGDLGGSKTNQTTSNYSDTNLQPEDIAYILYTSGSTGKPKGVMISHDASLNFVNWSYNCFQVQPSDRLSNHAPLHFDLSIFDIFTTIKAGATVILIPPSLSVFPLNLARYIAEQKITIWYSVPSILIQLILQGELQLEQFSHLRHILFAGEVFPLKYLKQLMEILPNVNYHNLYGPTETNVCTYYPVTKIPDDEENSLPIGKACANLEVFAINQQGKIAEIEEIGELYVSGLSLMSGYWGMSQATDQVLVKDPRFSESTTKVYRTGDLIKLKKDGNYLFLGRQDNQIKSRGYRIDLGEIESIIYKNPNVKEGVVIAIPDEQIGNKLQAFVVLLPNLYINTRDLTSFCAKYLPKYMIPEFEIRASLPKT